MPTVIIDSVSIFRTNFLSIFATDFLNQFPTSIFVADFLCRYF